MSVVAAMMGVEQAAKYIGIDAEKLKAWTTSGHAPHYYYDGAGPLFKKAELKAWASKNLLQANKGMPIPTELRVLHPVDRDSVGVVPASLCKISGLCVVNMSGTCPGVYFLCKGGEVVYVGASNHVAYRVATHTREGVKDFDHEHVLYLPVPEEQIYDVEEGFIESLRPRYNGSKAGIRYDDRKALV